ncbi:MAG: flagellar hook-length control protein FliK, partial [Gallionella sp.]|nr:flagellar hook-length control protein FliK [Gallionella sp.]
KTSDQGGDSFGAMLTRQMEEKNPPAVDNIAANTNLMPTRKTADGKDIQADMEAVPAGDNASLAFTAMLLVAPDTRLNAPLPPVTEGADTQGKANAGNMIASTAGMKPGLRDNLSATIGTADHHQAAATEKMEVGKSLTDSSGVANSSFREVAPASITPPSISAHAGALAAAGMQASALQAVAPQDIKPTHAGNPIAAPISSNAWPDEFSQQVSWISNQQNQSAELHLNPPDLGPIRVVLNVTDNQATALFSSPHLAVREAIESALPKLREVMADNGITLGNTTVSDQAPRDSGSYMNQRPNSRLTPITSGIATLEPASLTAPVTATRRHIGMVDTFA